MRRSVFLVVALLSAAVLVTAQQQPPAPTADPAQQPAVTFRSETNFVEVHAIVTVSTGGFV